MNELIEAFMAFDHIVGYFRKKNQQYNMYAVRNICNIIVNESTTMIPILNQK